MNWNFDTIFFGLFGLVCLYLAIKRSKWLFWGSSRSERLELSLGKNYKLWVNLTAGLLCLGIATWFLLR